MSWLRENRQGIGSSLNQGYALAIAFAVLLFAGSVAHSPAQLPKLRRHPRLKLNPWHHSILLDVILPEVQ